MFSGKFSVVRKHWAAIALVACFVVFPLRVEANNGIELGIDAGVNFEITESGNWTDVGIGGPTVGDAHSGVNGSAAQTVRLGVLLAEASEVELSTGFLFASRLGSTGERTSSSSLMLGISYLRGQAAGGNPAPYLRGGGLLRMETETYDGTWSQVGLLAGGGLKWRTGKVLGVRAEGTVSRWFDGDGFTGHWDVGLRIGISAFTKWDGGP